ncbi:MAG: hypothetical protein NZ823_17685 [Blastocatellia bacterium]|nr:hypothetical protein [Blastocatellia bacterium]
MAFEVQDYKDLVRLIEEHPEWRAELRRLVLTDELLELPVIVRELAEAQRHAEERLSRVEEQIALLTQAQRHAEERLSRVEEQIALLTEAQRRTEERLARVEEQMALLAEAQRQMADEIRKMAADQRRISNDVADLKGTVLEWKYRNKATAYFGAVLRRARVVEMQTLEERLEASLTEEEIKDVLRLDLIVQGRLSRQADAPEVYLAVEISSVIDAYDVQRARHRSYLLRKAGFPTIPMVAGEHLTPGAEFETKEHSVPVMQDGKVTYWEEALQRWATN